MKPDGTVQTEQTYKGGPVASQGPPVPKEFAVAGSSTGIFADAGTSTVLAAVAEASTNTVAAADVATTTEDIGRLDAEVQSGGEKANFSQYVKFTSASVSTEVQAEPKPVEAPSAASAPPVAKKPLPMPKQPPPMPPTPLFGVGSKASTAGFNEALQVVDLRRAVDWGSAARGAGDPIQHLLNDRHARTKLPQLNWIAEWIYYHSGKTSVVQFAINRGLNLWELQAVVGRATRPFGLTSCMGPGNGLDEKVWTWSH